MARCRKTVICLLVGSLLILTNRAVFAQRGRGVRSIDFRNFTYQLGDERGFGDESVRLGNGKYESPDNSPGGIVDSTLVAVKYADFDGDGQEEAAVELNLGINGSAGSIEEYFVFAYRKGAPQQTFRESREGGRRMNVLGRSIIISAPFWKSVDAHCCPSAVATDTYSWRGSRFARVSHRLRTLR